MRPAVFLFLLAPVLSAGAAAPEPVPTRIGVVDYVKLDDVAAYLGLGVEHVGPQTVLLKDGDRPVARLTEHSREMDLKGLRIFLGNPVNEKGPDFYVSRLDFRYRLLPRIRPALAGAPPGLPKVIALDPGHGGVDNGAENRALGTMEKTYTLDVAMRLRRLLEAAGYKVVLSRDSDYDVPKPQRAEIANQAGADLFVSIHFNSLYPNTKTTGAEVLVFPPPTQRSTDSWSAGGKDDSENAAVPANAFDSWSGILAGAVHKRLVDTLRDGDRGEKLAHFAMLRPLKCPGILVESAIISSDRESALLKTTEFRDKIAESIFAGIGDYADAVRSLQAQAGAAAALSAPAASRSQPTRPGGP
jgi:N-acetylmuramoyl-L-alanine amidase